MLEHLNTGVSQEVCLSFSIRGYRKTQMNFLTNPIFKCDQYSSPSREFL